MPPKRRVPKGPAPSGLTSVASFFAACSQAEALGAAAQQALQVQGGGRCRASELRKKRDKMQRKVTITDAVSTAGAARDVAPPTHTHTHSHTHPVPERRG